MIHNDDLSLTIKIPKTKDGNIHARVEYCRPDASELAASFKLHLRGHSLLNVRRNVLEKPEYYYEIHRRHQQHTAATPDDSDAWVLVHRSEKKGATNPFWDINFFDVEQFVNHDLSRDLRIRVFDLEVSAGVGRRRTIIGQVTTSSHGLLGAVTNNGNCDLSRAFQLLSVDGKKKVGQIVVVAAEFVTNDNISNDNFSSSTVITTAIAQPLSLSELEIMTPPATPTADSISVITTPTFVSSSASNNNNNAFDQVMTFCDLELCVAIDFTKGNGDPNVPGTSHYRSNNNLNDYQWTMTTVVETLAAYSERNEYSVWGFGGQYNGQDQPIFLCGQSAKARGTGGILSAYEATFQTEIAFGSSRKLDTIIAAAAQHARKSLAGAEQHDRRSYTVLLVLMIGEDRDILAAKDKLVAANSAPLSIIFLRLPSPGSSPFDPLKLEVYLGNKGCRDFCICQDMKTIVGTRDSEKLSKLIMKGLKQQVPKFFYG